MRKKLNSVLLVISIITFLLSFSLSNVSEFITLFSSLMLLLNAAFIFLVYYFRFGKKEMVNYILVNPADACLLSLSFFYGVSSLILYISQRGDLEIGLLKPYLYQNIINSLAGSSSIALLGVSIVGFVRGAKLNRPNIIFLKNINFDRVFYYFITIYLLSISIKVYAFSKGVTSFSSEIGFGAIFGPFSSFFSIIEAYSIIMPAAFIICYFQSKRKYFLIALLISMPIEVLFGVIYAQKIRIFTPIFTVLLSIIFFSKKIQFVKIFLLAGVGLLLFMAAMGARLIGMQGETIQNSGFFGFFFSALEQGFAGGDSYGTDRGQSLFGYLASRMNFLVQLASAMNVRLNDGIILLDLSSYLNIVFSPVPSFLFPWKPAPFDTNEFGRMTGLIDATDKFTAIRPSYFGDLIYNIGIPLFPVAALIFGFILRKINNIKIDFFGIFFALNCSFILIDIENTISNSIGGIVKLYILILMCRMYSTKKSKLIRYHGIQS